MQLIESHRSYGGDQRRYQHHSGSLGCDMHFSLYLPPVAEQKPVPLLIWLSGLTCDDQNFVSKAGAQRWAADAGIGILAPDTSPRGEGVADDPDGAYDFGLGAGFYVNATREPYARHYQMYDYITDELPRLLSDQITELDGRLAISGHSMGGHGALTIALKNPERFSSVSAFAPICSPTRCPWGQKALTGYLGSNPEDWADCDASLLIAAAGVDAQTLPIRIDQGGADDFLDDQLMPQVLLEAAAASGVAIDYHLHPGYDHSYFFIASFMEQHVAFHAKHLGAS
jgi:S-formylglutathione hydrolase